MLLLSDMDTFFAFLCIILAFFVGFGSSFAYNWHIKRTALSITRGIYGEKGRESKEKQESDLMALITEATMLFKNAREKGEDIKVSAAKIVPHLVGKYPMVMMKQGKKLYKLIEKQGGLEGLEDFF